MRFEWDGDHLFAVATNRYVLSWEESWPVEAEGREAFSVSTADAKRLIAMLPKTAYASDEVTVGYDEDARKAEFTSGNDTMIVSTEHGEYPKWRTLIPATGAREALNAITLGPKWLSLLAKVKAGRGDVPVRFEFNGAKPVHVMIGEHFKAIIVPIKHVG